MLVSILHRVMGVGLAVVGLPLFVWWLSAAAAGDESYRSFADWFTYNDGRLNIVGYVFGIGLTWAVLQHMMTGIRHFFLDVGAGYELKRNKQVALATMVVSIVLTILFWAFLVGIK